MNLSTAVLELARGGLAGLVVCVPPGPMSTLCVSRCVRRGFVEGFAVAAGSALGDATYVALAAFGVASFSDSIGGAPRVVAFVAAPFLLWMGVRMLRQARRAAEPTCADAPPAPRVDASRPLTAAATGYAMALGTPGTLPALVALLAALGPSPGIGVGLAAPFLTTAGALAAALLWWSGVAVLVCRYRAVVAGRLHLIDAAGGALLVVASVAALHVAISGGGFPSS